MPTPPRKPGTLVGISEIARKLGVSRQRAMQLADTTGFPAPEDVLMSGRVWRASTVEKWIREHRGPRADSS